MLTVAIVLSLIFTSLGFLVTAGNAKYMLSGYNTMSEADRAKMDIGGYLQFFKRFHIILGTTLITGYLILSFININWAGAFMIMYPIIAYIFLIARGNQFYRGTKGQRAGTYVGVAIIVVVAVVVGTQLYGNMKNSEISLQGDVLEIKDSYGLRIWKDDVSEITTVPELPPISMKSDGFSTGDFSKGSFRAEDGSMVMLFVNKKATPFLLIKTNMGEIYYSSDEASSSELAKKIKAWMSR